MNVNRLFFIVLLFAPAFANGADIGSVDAAQARLEIIAAIQNLIEVVSFTLGLLLMVAGGYKLKINADQNGKIGFGVAGVYVLVGAAMINMKESISTFTNTYFKVDFCKMIGDDGGISNSCFKDEISGLTGPIKERIAKLSSDTAAQKFIDNIETIVGIFQVIGFIYFLVGLYGMTQVAKGSANHGYGKPLITMVASALIVDIPHTATTFVDTLNKIGITF
ncbi:hypothetical protein [Metapseudomonas otitidis]|uniref:hypothetical protein n=1 Tax=Metapseudomonas otitidis TaxID=319939 RepID=UPI00209A8894|nr:hypothetical protein [Pseudomonas otitidis]MCO7557150.1 hypothetical protein [Pseudomonas otitidis]